MATLTTKTLTLPDHLLQGIVKSVTSGSTVAALSAAKPTLFGNSTLVTLESKPRAEFVEEGANKSATNATFGSVRVTPHKAQVTMRISNEVEWADEDYQLGIMQTLAEEGSIALARALDFGLIHRVNPSTGTVTDWTNYLTSTKKTVDATANIDADIEKAIGLVLTDGEGTDVNGLALSKPAAYALATAKDKQGHLMYPELGFGTGMTQYKGIKAAASTTVNGLPEMKQDSGIKAIVGDFTNGVYWGIQRNLPIEVIPYGDPDGQGDLKRANQIALRLEVQYAWYVFADRFAVVKTPAGSAVVSH